MAKPLTTQVIERARALIADDQHWCRGELARDERGHRISPTNWEARRFCALGALIAAAGEITGDPDLANELGRTAADRVSELAIGWRRLSLIAVNALLGRRAVQVLFDRALRRLQT